ncbi:MAG: ATP-binding cassette domain-containing protein, partial [Burkholderiales bacterium]|nr:ATP-binding cassette domain-containing protein [Burkholderiales bacterium]
MVEFEGVDFSYGSNAILRNLDMSFPRGKVIAIMGGSGSGKTTMLRLIGGQIKA